MPDTHDYKTKQLNPLDLNETHVLVGDSGGLSAVLDKAKWSNVMSEMVRVETEHGPLYLDPDEKAEVLDE